MYIPKSLLVILLFIVQFSSLGQITHYKVSEINTKKYDPDLEAYSNWAGWEATPEGLINISLSPTGIKLTLSGQIVTLKFTEDIASKEWILDKKAKAFVKGKNEPVGDAEFYGKITLEELIAGKGRGHSVYVWLSIPGVIAYMGFILE